MKKWKLVLLAAAAALSVAACGGKKEEPVQDRAVAAAPAETTAAETKEAETKPAPKKAAETKAAETKAEEKKETAKEYVLDAYTANGQTYDDPKLLQDLGMADTYFIMKDDNSGTFCLSGEKMEIRWTDKGVISVSGVPMYTYEMDGDDALTINMMDTLYFHMVKGDTKAIGTAKDDKKPEETKAAAAAADLGKTEGVYKLFAVEEDGVAYGAEIMGLEDAPLTLNADGTGTIVFENEEEITWKEDGGKLILTAEGDDVEASVKDGVVTLELEEGLKMYYAKEGADVSGIEVSGLDDLLAAMFAELGEGDDTETEAEVKETKADEKETEAVQPAGTPGEPVAKGDGVCAGKDDVLRLMRYWEYCDEMGIKLSYEDMVEVAGVEGKDGGNRGANTMTEYGDRIVFWYIDDHAYVYYTFRRPADKDEWKAVQWASQNIDRKDWEEFDISDMIPQADPSSFEVQDYSLKAFMTDIETSVKVSVPTTMWITKKDNDYTVKLWNTATENRNAPRVEINVQSSEERINFYKDSFENLKEIENRTISGIDMVGRTYKDIGCNWTEWYGELPSGIWASIKVAKMDVTDGSEVSAIIDTIELN